MNPIDLGQKYGEAMSLSPTSKPEEPSVCYPCLCINGASAKLAALPKSGKMTVTFERTSKTVREGKDGEETVDLCLDVKRILDVQGDDETEGKSSGGYDRGATLAALDTLAAAVAGSEE